MLGYNLREMYLCDGVPSDETCVSDNYVCNNTRVPQRIGTAAAHLPFGGQDACGASRDRWLRVGCGATRRRAQASTRPLW